MTRSRSCVLIGALAVLFGTVAFAQARPDDKPPVPDEKSAAVQKESPADKALAAFRKGAWDDVVALGAAVKPSSAAYPRVQYVVGEARLQTGAWKEAEVAFRAVLAKKPSAVPARTGLGKALAGLGEHKKAEKAFEAAVKKDLKDAAAHLAFGEFLLARERTDDALKSLRRAYRLDKKNGLVVRGLVDGLIRKEELKQAGKVAAALAKATPKHPMGHFLSGWVLDRRGRVKDAIAAYDKALEMDGTFLDAHKNLAILCIARNPMYRDVDRREKAFEHFKRYFELGGDDPELKRVYETIKSVLPKLVK